jgi:hypothetical protein
MSPICTFILSHYATGKALSRVCRDYLVEYCEEHGLESTGYNKVKQWLTMSCFEEEFNEFRKEYKVIQKNLIPILIDELREDAQELMFQKVTDKHGNQKTDPRYFDGFRARFAALKFLESYHRAPKRTNLAHKAREKAGETKKIVNRKPQIVNGSLSNPQFSEIFSQLRGININLPSITHSEAEEILGSPILNVINDEPRRGVLHTPGHGPLPTPTLHTPLHPQLNTAHVQTSLANHQPQIPVLHPNLSHSFGKLDHGSQSSNYNSSRRSTINSRPPSFPNPG